MKCHYHFTILSHSLKLKIEYEYFFCFCFHFIHVLICSKTSGLGYHGNHKCNKPKFCDLAALILDILSSICKWRADHVLIYKLKKMCKFYHNALKLALIIIEGIISYGKKSHFCMIIVIVDVFTNIYEVWTFYEYFVCTVV